MYSVFSVLIGVDVTFNNPELDEELLSAFHSHCFENQIKFITLIKGVTDLSIVDMKTQHSIRIYFWCKTVAAIRYLYELLKKKRIAKIINKLFIQLFQASENPGLAVLDLNENIDSPSEDESEGFVASIDYDEMNFFEHLTEIGKTLFIC